MKLSRNAGPQPALCFFLLTLMILASVGCGTASSANRGTTTTPTNSPTNSPPAASAPQNTFSYVNNPKSNNVFGFSANNQTSSVSAISGSPFAVPTYPADVATSGSFIFVESTGVNALNPAEYVLTSYKVDATTGALTSSSTLNVGSMFGGDYPSNIAVDPAGKYLYMSVIGPSPNPPIGVFSIDPNTGSLSEVTTSEFTSAQPFAGYRMVVSPNEKFLFVAAAVGTASTGTPPPQGVQPITRDPNTGILSSTLVPLAIPKSSVGSSNIEAMAVTPSNNFLLGTAVSLNQVFVWSIEPNTGALTQVSVFGDPQAITMIAPRGIAVDPTGKFAIVAGSDSNNLSVFSISSSGSLAPVAGSPFPAGSGPTSVAINASGNLVFVGNVGSNDMSVFQFDSNTGALTPVQGSPFPIGESAFNLMTVVTIH